MALSADMVWEVRQGGNAANSGGFKAGAVGVDRTLSASPYGTFDGSTVVLTAAGAQATMTLTGYTASDDDIGNTVLVSGGTNATAGYYEITARTGTDTWTVDRNWCTGAVTDGAGRMGGAVDKLSTLIKSSGQPVIAGNTVWVKDDGTPYSHAAIIATGAAGTSTAWISYKGYGTTRGDTGRPTLQASASLSGRLLNVHGHAYQYVKNLILDANNQATTGGLQCGADATIIDTCKVLNYNGTAGIYVYSGNNCTLFNCEATSAGTSATAGFYFDTTYNTVCVGCTAHDNAAGAGFSTVTSYRPTLAFCLAADNATYGFSAASGAGFNLINCSAYSNTTADYYYGTANIAATSVAVNCISYGGGTYSFRANNTIAGEPNGHRYNAYDAAPSQMDAGVGDVTLTADPFVSAGASDDYDLNATAGGGAACKEVGFPGAFPGMANTVGKVSIGASQPPLPTSGGPVGASMRGGFVNG